jgi:AraC-like DNA-binding protein
LEEPGKPHHSVGAGSRWGTRREMPVVGLAERVYEPTKLAALFDVLVSQGHRGEEILRHVNLSVTDVHSPKTRISLKQMMIACNNALQLSGDRHLPYRVGTSIHLSTYGMYGFAILCCPNFRKAMEFASRYHALAAPLTTIDFAEKEGLATWTIEPKVDAITNFRLYRFITEMQIGIHISLMRDIMGPSFTLTEIHLNYFENDDFGLPTDQLGCAVRFASSSNQIVFQSIWLDQAANLGNKTTYPTIVALCDDLLDDLELRTGVAGKIRTLLLRDIANPPTLAAVANLLAANERSLRRQLRQQGLSFRGLLDELRAQIAMKYLRTTTLANEEIALALGFSDARNFRRAFRRWTNRAPGEIRTK